MTVGELEHGRGTPMSSIEMTEWRAYYGVKAAEAKLNAAGVGPSSGGGNDMPPVMGPE